MIIGLELWGESFVIYGTNNYDLSWFYPECL